ncbi:MAG: FeoA domain-containing protein [Anaerolineales bacterium]|nr:FeoA domain-containing protein [Anaerolineales bacterium]
MNYPVFLALILALVAAVAWPRFGLLALWQRLRANRRRIRTEDALKHLHACAWRGQSATLQSLAGALHLTLAGAVRLVGELEAQGLLRAAEDGLHLTPDGEQIAVAVIRAHRLWERYLVDEARMPLAEVHHEAERREHSRSAEALGALDAALGHPAADPHGDPIPTVTGRIERVESRPLTDWPLDAPARIVHLEDEPAALFAQIAAEGLRPGQTLRVLESAPQRLTLSDGRKTFALAPLVAANIFVAPEPANGHPADRRLTALKQGERALVRALDDGLQGFTRRRLLDLGLTPGVPVTAELPSLFGDPVAYRVRGTLIALRRDQAEQVLIAEPASAAPAPSPSAQE